MLKFWSFLSLYSKPSPRGSHLFSCIISHRYQQILNINILSSPLCGAPKWNIQTHLGVSHTQLLHNVLEEWVSVLTLQFAFHPVFHGSVNATSLSTMPDTWSPPSTLLSLPIGKPSPISIHVNLKADLRCLNLPSHWLLLLLSKPPSLVTLMLH